MEVWRGNGVKLGVLIWDCGAEMLLLPFGASSVNNGLGWWWGDFWGVELLESYDIIGSGFFGIL